MNIRALIILLCVVCWNVAAFAGADPAVPDSATTQLLTTPQNPETAPKSDCDCCKTDKHKHKKHKKAKKSSKTEHEKHHHSEK